MLMSDLNSIAIKALLWLVGGLLTALLYNAAGELERNSLYHEGGSPIGKVILDKPKMFWYTIRVILFWPWYLIVALSCMGGL